MAKELFLWALGLAGVELSKPDPLELYSQFVSDTSLRHMVVDVQVFMLEFHKKWKVLDKKRTVRQFNATVKEKTGIASAYHRLTGRLNLSRSECRDLLSVMLQDWEDGQPHINFDTSKVGAFVDWLHYFTEKVDERIERCGLNQTDLTTLIETSELLGRPIKVNEIAPILKAKMLADEE